VALFQFDVHLTVPDGFLAKLKERLDLIMTTQAELQSQIEILTAQAEKAKAEIVAKIAALQEAIENGLPVSDSVLWAFAALKAAVQGVDDIVPEAQPEPEPEPEPLAP
jgi:uncharacterized protein YoxC